MTPRIAPIDPQGSTGLKQTLFETIKGKYGAVPNVFRTTGNSDAALAAYVGISDGLAASTLDFPLRELIALTVAETNGCHYCLSAHTAIGKSLGFDENTITSAREAHATDARVAAALTFARRLVEARGHVTDDDMRAVRAAGYSDAEIIDIIAQVTHDTFTNYVAIATQTVSEFPTVAPPRSRAA